MRIETREMRASRYFSFSLKTQFGFTLTRSLSLWLALFLSILKTLTLPECILSDLHRSKNIFRCWLIVMRHVLVIYSE